jgi:hypothetical protein
VLCRCALFQPFSIERVLGQPNVFEISTLNERPTTMAKRQEICHGLQRPVNP